MIYPDFHTQKDKNNMFPENPTRTEQTTAIYLKRAANLAKRAKTDLRLDHDDPLDARQFAAWLAKLKPTLSKPSWRQYKSAAICFLERYTDEEATEAVDFLRELDTDGCTTETDKTSSTKLKRFPWKDFQKITDHLRATPGKWHNPLLDWLVSASLTGLRPQEWVAAKLTQVAGEPALVVNNAKGTNGRSHGPDRTLLLASLAQEEIDTIRKHIDRVSQWAGMEQFDDFYNGCAATLNYLTRKLWPRRQRHITLYSCRHQFTANAKASGFSTAEIAAMMGHGVDVTATRHYGKKAAGHELLRVRALQDDIDRVDQKFAKTLMGKKAIARADPQPKPRKSAVADLDGL